MRAELIVHIAETAKIDDALHAGRRCGFRKGRRKVAIDGGEIGARLHRVDEIEDRLAACQLIGQAGRIRKIALHDLDRRILTPGSIAQFLRRADEAAHLVPGGREPRHQPGADISGGAHHRHAGHTGKTPQCRVARVAATAQSGDRE